MLLAAHQCMKTPVRLFEHNVSCASVENAPEAALEVALEAFTGTVEAFTGTVEALTGTVEAFTGTLEGMCVTQDHVG